MQVLSITKPPAIVPNKSQIKGKTDVLRYNLLIKIVICNLHYIEFSMCFMNICSQSYKIATTPTERNSKAGWYKIHNSYGMLAKRLHPSAL